MSTLKSPPVRSKSLQAYTDLEDGSIQPGTVALVDKHCPMPHFKLPSLQSDRLFSGVGKLRAE